MKLTIAVELQAPRRASALSREDAQEGAWVLSTLLRCHAADCCLTSVESGSLWERGPPKLCQQGQRRIKAELLVNADVLTFAGMLCLMDPYAL